MKNFVIRYCGVYFDGEPCAKFYVYPFMSQDGVSSKEGGTFMRVALCCAGIQDEKIKENGLTIEQIEEVQKMLEDYLFEK